MSIREWLRAIFLPRRRSADEALTLSFGSLERWLGDVEATRQFAFLQMFVQVPSLLAEWRDEFHSDIQQVFAVESAVDQKIRLRELTIARGESLALNKAYRARTEAERRVLAAALIGQGESFDETEAISSALAARAECTLMLARQLQKQFFGDVAPHDYFGTLLEAHNLYVNTIFDVTLKKHSGADASVEALMIQPLQQMVEQIKAEARTGSDRRYPSQDDRTSA
jgi:hypothetical protein